MNTALSLVSGSKGNPIPQDRWDFGRNRVFNLNAQRKVFREKDNYYTINGVRVNPLYFGIYYGKDNSLYLDHDLHLIYDNDNPSKSRTMISSRHMVPKHVDKDSFQRVEEITKRNIWGMPETEQRLVSYDLKYNKKTPDLDECMLQCHALAGCTGGEWNPENEQCQLTAYFDDSPSGLMARDMTTISMTPSIGFMKGDDANGVGRFYHYYANNKYPFPVPRYN